MRVTIINTKTAEAIEYRTLADGIAKHKPESAKTGYTFKVYNTDTGEIVGNIRPNPRQYKTKSNPNGKLTARFIRQD